LAEALHRRPITIRTWIRKHWLPEAWHRTEPIPRTRGDAGRRLWTAEQINAIVAIAQDEGLLGDHPPRIQSTRFVQRVHKQDV
jgi:hypothetical protein